MAQGCALFNSDVKQDVKKSGSGSPESDSMFSQPPPCLIHVFSSICSYYLYGDPFHRKFPAESDPFHRKFNVFM